MHVLAAVGDQRMAVGDGGPTGPAGGIASSNLGEVAIELLPSERRIYGSEQLGLLWRDATGPIPEAVAVDFSLSIMSPGERRGRTARRPGPGPPAGGGGRRQAVAPGVRWRLRGDRLVPRRQGGDEARHQAGGGEPRPDAAGPRAAGPQAFYGEEAQRIQRGRDDIRVMVRFPRDERRSLARRPREHAHPHLRRRRARCPSAKSPSSSRARLRFHPPRRPQPGRQRWC